MTQLLLQIENYDRLSDGGPVSITIGPRGAQIGRSAGMDWVLPDPTRHISSHHFDVSFADGGFWVTDRSTNGTYMQGSQYRLGQPHRLASGDRLQVGHYIIVAQLVQGQPAAPPPAQGTTDPFWQGGASPIAPAPFPGEWGGDSAAGNIDPWAVAAPLAPVDVNRAPPSRRHDDFGDEFIQTPRYFAPPEPPAPYPPPPAPFAAPPVSAMPHPQPQSPQPEPEAASAFTPPPPGHAVNPGPDLPPAAPTPEAAAQPAFGEMLQSVPRPRLDPLPETPMPKPQVLTPPQLGAETGMATALATPSLPPQPMQGGGHGTPPPHGAPAPKAPHPAAHGSGQLPAEFITAFCTAAGLDPKLAEGLDAATFGRILGEVMKISTEELMSQLKLRAAARRFTRSAEQTMRRATDNNPLKFLPGPEQALEAVLFRPRAGFLSGAAAIGEAHADLRRHSIAVFAALQPALVKLVEDLSPDAIEASSSGKGFLSGQRKAKFWDSYVETWDAKTHPHENGMLDAFLILFAKGYGDALISQGEQNPD